MKRALQALVTISLMALVVWATTTKTGANTLSVYTESAFGQNVFGSATAEWRRGFKLDPDALLEYAEELRARQNLTAEETQVVAWILMHGLEPAVATIPGLRLYEQPGRHRLPLWRECLDARRGLAETLLEEALAQFPETPTLAAQLFDVKVSRVAPMRRFASKIETEAEFHGLVDEFQQIDRRNGYYTLRAAARLVVFDAESAKFRRAAFAEAKSFPAIRFYRPDVVRFRALVRQLGFASLTRNDLPGFDWTQFQRQPIHTVSINTRRTRTSHTKWTGVDGYIQSLDNRVALAASMSVLALRGCILAIASALLVHLLFRLGCDRIKTQDERAIAGVFAWGLGFALVLQIAFLANPISARSLRVPAATPTAKYFEQVLNQRFLERLGYTVKDAHFLWSFLPLIVLLLVTVWMVLRSGDGFRGRIDWRATGRRFANGARAFAAACFVVSVVLMFPALAWVEKEHDAARAWPANPTKVLQSQSDFR